MTTQLFPQSSAINEWRENMNKQEKGKLYEFINRSQFLTTIEGDGICKEIYAVPAQRVQDFVKTLNDPQKVTVPKLVADWFEEHKDDLEFAIWKLTIDSNDNPTLSRNEMRNWIQHAPNKPYKTLIRMLEGYEIEKDSLFLMPVPYVPFPVHYCVDEDGKVSYRQGNAQKFTQEELDKYFSEIKQFAVPVEANES